MGKWGLFVATGPTRHAPAFVPIALLSSVQRTVQRRQFERLVLNPIDRHQRRRYYADKRTVRTSKHLLLALMYAGAAPGQQPAASLPTLTQAAVPLPTQFVLNSWDTTTGLPEE